MSDHDGGGPPQGKTLGELIAWAIRNAGYSSQAEFARAIGFSVKSVSVWVRDKQAPSPRSLQRVAKKTGVPLAAFVERHPRATRQPDQHDGLDHQPTLKELLNTVERMAIVAALAENEWKQGRAAASLGISRRTLIYKLHKYGISGQYWHD